MIRNLSRAYARYCRQRDNYEALSRLNDHELEDIGLTRADLRRVARATL